MCHDLWTVANQAPLSMGFRRQEYWSGLPFTPPGDLSDPGTEPCLLWLLHWQAGSLSFEPPGKSSRMYCMPHYMLQSCPTLCDPMDIQSTEVSRPEYSSGSLATSPGDLPNPGIKPRSPTLQAYSLPAEPPGKPKNSGVGSPSVLQGIFLTQGLYRGFLHCRQILY